MPITRFDHYTVRTNDVDATWRFYERALGFNVRKREGFPIPAFIVSTPDGTEVVHGFAASEEMESIFERLKPADDDTAKWRTGRLQHVEFWATDLDEFRKRFNSESVPFSERTLPDKHQVGVTDPNGIVVNLNFPLSEVGK